MRIKILGYGDQSRGKSFELLMQSVLDLLGYTDFKMNIRPAAMELDIEAVHKSNKDKILCECKGQDDPIAITDVEKFHSKLNYEMDKGYAHRGFLFSISGFTQNVDRWYKDSGKKTKKTLILKGTEGIIDLLRESNTLASDEILNGILKNNTSYQFGERYIVVYQSDLYIVQFLASGDEVTSYMILKGTGNLVSSPITNEISKLDKELKKLTKLNLNITKKVTLNLLDLKAKTIENISNYIQETIHDVNVAIGDLQIQRIVISPDSNGESTEVTHMINTDIPSLITLTQRFAFDVNKFHLMSSPYIDTVVNDKFADYVIERYKISADENIRSAIIKSARIFPSILHFLLLGDTSSYQHFYNSKQKFQERPDAEQFDKIIVSELFRVIYQEILNDLRTIPLPFLVTKQILGYYSEFDLRFASELDLILKITGKMHTYIVNKGPEEIPAGEILSPVDISSNIKLGNHLLSLAEYKTAIETYDIVIDNSIDVELRSMAWNNKSQCFRMMGQHEVELQCIEKALEYKITREALSNKILCLEALNRTAEIEEVRQQLADLPS